MTLRIQANDIAQAKSIALASSSVAVAREAHVSLLSDIGEFLIRPAWKVDQCSLAPSGRHLIIHGDDGRRVGIWETATGRQLFSMGDQNCGRRQFSGGLVETHNDLLAFIYDRTRPSRLSVFSTTRNSPLIELAATAQVGFRPTNVRTINSGAFAVIGHADGEQYDTAVAIRVDGLDVMSLQEALTTAPSIRQWGYRVSIGPGPGNSVVTYRDAGWDPDDPPDDPDEAFIGFEIWDCETRQVTSRVQYVGAVPIGANVGANELSILVEFEDHVVEVSRSSGATRRIDAIALDPYRMEIAAIEGNEIVVRSAQ